MPHRKPTKGSTKARELEARPNDPLPPGYRFVPKGNVYITKHCRTQTHAAAQPLYVVLDRRTNKPLGLRCPLSIYHSVLAQHIATAAQRAAAVQRRDEAIEDNFEEAVVELFPSIPREEVGQIVKHALLKNSRRVGRAGKVEMRVRVKLAVMAHIRHVHTDYDGLLKEGVSREVAREKVWERLNEVARKWGGRRVKAAPAKDKRVKRTKGSVTAGVGKTQGRGVAKRAVVKTTEVEYGALTGRTRRLSSGLVTNARALTRRMVNTEGGDDNTENDVFSLSEDTSDNDSDYSEWGA